MTLIEKLKPEYSNIFEKNNLEYPALVARIIYCFEETEFVSDIPLVSGLTLNFLLTYIVLLTYLQITFNYGKQLLWSITFVGNRCVFRL